MASKKKRREVKAVKVKEELAEVKKSAREKAVEVYKAFMDFVAEKARVVVIFCTSENSTLIAINLVRRPSIKASNWVRMTAAPRS